MDAVSKSPRLPPSAWCFNEFDIETALAPQRGANFGGGEFQKVLRSCQFLKIIKIQIALVQQRSANLCDLNFKKCPEPARILTPESLSRHSVVQASSAADPPQLPFLRADFSRLRSRKTMKKQCILRDSYRPKPPHLTHLSCITSARSHLLADRSSAETLSGVGS